ncbi:NAD(P)H-binding protein [Niveibacterium sp. 24ML]|uniref:NAD-dependent epimerase/dehydratase family protein n=1 Tax=Niveibacterium sp. 24ML TaxID=2985512 RepID=UPI00227229C7|nr:NAD-dependent epimerase/dehydratase family protein [Niveibacterium sp. 24ML]MCX9157458.1 NAD(P)H-binding protein [Niveibacterium sp. 24ML]
MVAQPKPKRRPARPATGLRPAGRIARQRVLIIGSGDVAARAIPLLVRHTRVFAVVRRDDAARCLRALGAVPLRADLDEARSLQRLSGLAPSVLHFAPPPDRGDSDPRSRRLTAALARRSLPRRLVYISTTGVYGDCRGQSVPETRPLRASTARAKRRVAAERILRNFARRSGCRLAILRAPGIYAAERLNLARLERGDPVLPAGEDVFTNHIHADDLARLAIRALFRGGNCRAWNVTDDSELRMGEWYDRMADTFGLPRPPRASRSELERVLSPMMLSFMSESRRLDNTRMHRELRVQLTYPTVDAGLAQARAWFDLQKENSR